MDTAAEVKAVVIDAGSYQCKAGYSIDEAPTATFFMRDFSAQQKIEKALAKLKPDSGDRSTMEALYHRAFKEVRVDPEDYPVLLTEPPLNRKTAREEVTQLMFEKFHTPAFYLAVQGVLALYATGRTTGLVLDAGHSFTHTVPVYMGYQLPHAVATLNVRGSDLTAHLATLLSKEAKTEVDKQAVRDAKEKLCYVALDIDEETKKLDTAEMEQKYELPNGEVITVGSERVRCPELLFRRPLIGAQEGIHRAIQHAIALCDVNMRKELYENIVLAGGTTMFEGLVPRLEKEMKNLLSPDMPFKIVAPPQRQFSAWLGGAILASLSTFQQQWITKQDYDEWGPVVVHRKCF